MYPSSSNFYTTAFSISKKGYSLKICRCDVQVLEDIQEYVETHVLKPIRLKESAESAESVLHL